MVHNRETFRNILIKALPEGNQNLYFQPPAGFKMNFPCIIYSEIMPNMIKANNMNYITTKQYRITVIDRNPDTQIPDKIVENFKMCRILDRSIIDNLYHIYLEIYF